MLADIHIRGIRATDMQDMGSSPGGGKAHFLYTDINLNTITTLSSTASKLPVNVKYIYNTNPKQQ